MRPGADHPLFQLAQQPLLLRGAALLRGGSFGEDGAVAAAVELDNLQRDRAADPFGERALGVLRGAAVRPGDDLRQRHEGVDAFDVDEKSTLVAAGDVGLKRLVGVHVVLEYAPAAFAAGAVQGEDDLSFVRFGLDHGDKNLVAVVEARCALRLQALHFVGRDDAFGLGADVNQDAVPVSANYRPFNDLAAPDFGVGGGLFIEERGHRVFFDGGGGCSSLVIFKSQR